MPKQRTQPKRTVKSNNSMDTVMCSVLDQLKKLNDRLDCQDKKIEEIANRQSQQESPKNGELPSSSRPQQMNQIEDVVTPAHQHINEIAGPSVVNVPSPASPSIAPVCPQHGARVPASSLPLVDIVPQNLRKDILKGKDINLVQLLLPARERSTFVGSREINIGDETLVLKPLADNRLKRALTITEFIKAFNIYKNVICDQYPLRREELERYTSNMINVATTYPGFAFYDYHLEFSARAAHHLEHDNILLDWGVMDNRLLTQVTAGRKANTCSLCSGFDHTAQLCHLATTSNNIRKMDNSQKPVCKIFNSSTGCMYKDRCRFLHICSVCKSREHSAVECAKKLRA